MRNYSKLLEDLYDQDKTYWEELSNDQKNQLINAYIIAKPIEIPAEVGFQQIVLSAVNKQTYSKVDEASIKSLFFQAIKNQIEKDMENKWMDIEGELL